VRKFVQLFEQFITFSCYVKQIWPDEDPYFATTPVLLLNSSFMERVERLTVHEQRCKDLLHHDEDR
jgi:hypothetical protein